MSIDIRPMPLDYRTVFARLLTEIPQFKPAEVEVALELIDAYLTCGIQSGYHILVAEMEGTPAGYICFGPTPLTENTWDIYWEAVSPGFQRRGIGGLMLEAAEKQIRDCSGKMVLIETSSTPAYSITRSFYRRHGYRKICRIRNFYSRGDDRLTYSKILS